MNYLDLLAIVKEYGRVKGKVWFFNSLTRQKMLVEYDGTRRYFMSVMNGDTMHRVTEDTFRSNVDWLAKHEFYICF